MKRYRLNTRGKIQLIALIFIIGIVAIIHVNDACSDDCIEEPLLNPNTLIEYEYSEVPELKAVFEVRDNVSADRLREEYIASKNTLPVLRKSSAKTYEDYKMITSKTSPQWDMIYNQDLFNINDEGFLVTDDGFYAVALGSYFGWCGSKYIMVTDEGNRIPVILLDLKKDIHTDENNFVGSNNNDIIEFVVDSSVMPKWQNGFVYGGNFNNIEKFKGNIVEIIVVERIEK